jgi:pyruvate dehydrogenase E2 component (dihydrolipoamide acetyltransferase)
MTPDPIDGRRPVTPTPMRKAIARRMVESKRNAPHFYISTEMELDAVLALAGRMNEGRPHEERLTITAFLIRAVALTLTEHPTFNATWRGGTLELVDAINVGVAIPVDDGLIAPAILDCAALDIEAIGGRLRDLIARSRSGRLRPAEIDEPTFTVSNLGMFDVSSFIAIIPPPQIAILAAARAEHRAVVRSGAIVIRQVVTATLSADHRSVDGAGAARFLGDVKRRLQSPEGLQVAGYSA